MITHQPIFSCETLDRTARQRCPANVKRWPFTDSKTKELSSFGGPRGLVAFFPNFEAENQGNELTDTMRGIRMTLKLERNRHPFQMFPLMEVAYACQHRCEHCSGRISR